MKSNVISFKRGQAKFAEILKETEKVATYNELSSKESLRLRLLAEELQSILKELVDEFDGEFWIENEGKDYQINLSVVADSMDEETKEKLISVSSSGKNELAKGFMGMLRGIVEFFAVGYAPMSADYCGYYVDSMDVMSVHGADGYSNWSLERYKSDVKAKNNGEWDELEKSIVASLADDVIVGVMGKKVLLSVKKSF